MSSAKHLNKPVFIKPTKKESLIELVKRPNLIRKN